MKMAQVIIFGIQCFNLGLLIMLGIIMLTNQIQYNKRQKEYKKKEQEILNKYKKENNNGESTSIEE